MANRRAIDSQRQRDWIKRDGTTVPVSGPVTPRVAAHGHARGTNPALSIMAGDPLDLGKWIHPGMVDGRKGWVVGSHGQEEWLRAYANWLHRARAHVFRDQLEDLFDALTQTIKITRDLSHRPFTIEAQDLVAMHNQTIVTMASHGYTCEGRTGRWVRFTGQPSSA